MTDSDKFIQSSHSKQQCTSVDREHRIVMRYSTGEESDNGNEQNSRAQTRDGTGEVDYVIEHLKPSEYSYCPK